MYIYSEDAEKVRKISQFPTSKATFFSNCLINPILKKKLLLHCISEGKMKCRIPDYLLLSRKVYVLRASQVALVVKNLPANA